MTDLDQQDDEYELEKIVKHRYKRKRIEFLVKWKGYGDEENTWQGVETLNAPLLLKEYWKHPVEDLPPIAPAPSKAPIAPALAMVQPKTEAKANAPANPTGKTPVKTPRMAKAPSKPLASTSSKTPAKTSKVPATSSSSQHSSRLSEPKQGQKRLQSATPAGALSTSVSTQKKPKTLKQPQVIPHNDETPTLPPLDHVSLETYPKSSPPSIHMSTRIHHDDKALAHKDGDKLGSNSKVSDDKENNEKDSVILKEPITIQKNTIDFAGKKLNVDDTLQADRNWETEVAKIETMKIRREDGVASFDLVVRWENGDLTAHTSKFVKRKCPQIVFDFYEKKIASLS